MQSQNDLLFNLQNKIEKSRIIILLIICSSGNKFKMFNILILPATIQLFGLMIDRHESHSKIQIKLWANIEINIKYFLLFLIAVSNP